MAYQKLQVERALEVIASDTINIPNVAGATLSGTTDGTGTNQLVDSAQDFTAGNINGLAGSIIYTPTTAHKVIGVVDANTLSITGTIASSQAYVIYSDANTGCVLYSGAGGDIKVLTAGNDEVTFTGVAAGAFIPVQVLRVFATPAPPAGIIALW